MAGATSLSGYFYPIVLRTLGKVSHGTYITLVLLVLLRAQPHQLTLLPASPQGEAIPRPT